jgi:hypothetical protein
MYNNDPESLSTFTRFTFLPTLRVLLLISQCAVPGIMSLATGELWADVDIQRMLA